MKKYICLSILLLMAACAPRSENFYDSEGNFIVDGDRLESGDRIYPFLVAVVIEVEGGKADICTGSVLNRHTILTAAHCLTDLEGRVFVVFNAKPKSAFQKVRGGGHRDDVRVVEKFVIHPQYAKFRCSVQSKECNDVAILKLDSDIPKSGQAVKFLDAKSVTNVNQMIVAGYGFQDKKATKGIGILRSVQVQVKSTTDQEYISIDQSHGHGVCSGDSGGPGFVLDAVTKEPLLYTVNSSVLPSESNSNFICGGEGFLLNVSRLQPWILTTVQSLKCLH